MKKKVFTKIEMENGIRGGDFKRDVLEEKEKKNKDG